MRWQTLLKRLFPLQNTSSDAENFAMNYRISESNERLQANRFMRPVNHDELQHQGIPSGVNGRPLTLALSIQLDIPVDMKPARNRIEGHDSMHECDVIKPLRRASDNNDTWEAFFRRHPGTQLEEMAFKNRIRFA